MITSCVKCSQFLVVPSMADCQKLQITALPCGCGGVAGHAKQSSKSAALKSLRTAARKSMRRPWTHGDGSYQRRPDVNARWQQGSGYVVFTVLYRRTDAIGTNA
jgi:hypothetical protein